MPEVIGVFDHGTAIIRTAHGPKTVGVVTFRTQERESVPVDHLGYCQLYLKDSIIKYLSKIHWIKPAPEMVKAENHPPAPGSVLSGDQNELEGENHVESGTH